MLLLRMVLVLWKGLVLWGGLMLWRELVVRSMLVLWRVLVMRRVLVSSVGVLKSMRLDARGCRSSSGRLCRIWVGRAWLDSRCHDLTLAKNGNTELSETIEPQRPAHWGD